MVQILYIKFEKNLKNPKKSDKNSLNIFWISQKYVFPLVWPDSTKKITSNFGIIWKIPTTSRPPYWAHCGFALYFKLVLCSFIPQFLGTKTCIVIANFAWFVSNSNFLRTWVQLKLDFQAKLGKEKIVDEFSLGKRPR